MKKPTFCNNWIPVLFLIVILLIVYLTTLAPGLSWANNSADGGDLITAAATNGVAHPTGYPTYLLIAKIFQLIPIGSIAYRTNLLSVIAVIGTAVIVYFLVINIPKKPTRINWGAGLISSLTFGLAPIIWSQAIITEVYGLHVFFTSLLLFLFFITINNNSDLKTDSLIGLIFGLSLGNHMSTLIFAPLVFSLGIIKNDRCKKPQNQQQPSLASWKFTIIRSKLFKRILWLMIGLSIYLTIFLRAHSISPIKWENPVNISNLIRLISGQLYKDYFFDFPLSLLFTRIQAFANIFLTQTGFIGLVAGLFGLIYVSKPRWFLYASLWIMMCSLIFAIGYNTFDSYLYLIPIFLIFSIWIGIGFINFLSKFLIHNKWVVSISLFCFAIILSIQIIKNWQTVDASKDVRAEKFGQTVFGIIPKNAIVFANGDNAVFSLWYFHFVLNQRSDLTILSTNLLSYSWYREGMREIYPSILIPDNNDDSWKELIITENSDRISCDVSYLEDTQIYCSVN